MASNCSVFLPLIQGPPLVPQLNEPADGAQIVSRAPLLTWTPTLSSTYQVQVSTEPTFATTEVNSVNPWFDPLPALAVHITGSNLAVATTYYWRVGIRYAGSYHYTPVRTFRTPASSPALPPPPALAAPANGATLPTREVTLGWQAVPGALYYRVRVFSPDSTVFDSKVVPATTLSHYVAGLVPGTTYTWRVRTLDQYGWGPFSDPWSFTAP
ncbi:MAG: fibronectin type III domain-containing protein [Roseiflexaceae bacterium]